MAAATKSTPPTPDPDPIAPVDPPEPSVTPEVESSDVSRETKPAPISPCEQGCGAEAPATLAAATAFGCEHGSWVRADDGSWD